LVFVFMTYLGVVAQPTNLPPGASIAFFTSFENPAALDCVVLGGTPTWLVDPAYRFPAGQGQAVRGRISNSTSSWMTTKPFSTSGNFKVFFDFAHIAKLEFQDSALVQISIDGGQTFTNLTGANCRYFGASTNFRTFNRFNQTAYPLDWDQLNLGASPQQSWWKVERFDISNIASNLPDVRLRFRVSDGNGNGLGAPAAYGWLIDSIQVTVSISELIQPVVQHAPIRNVQFNIRQTISANIADSAGCDSSGVHDAWLFFRVNGGALDSLQMLRNNPATQPNNYQVLLDSGRVMDGDTVSYFIRARDSAPARNVRYFPNSDRSGPGGDSVITYIASWLPTLAHTPITGQQFSAGPFAINVNASDASGIDSAILHYRLNSGPWITRKMPFVSGILYRDTITPIDGDTVDYYIEAVDNSLRRFRRQLPDTAQFWRFIASGDPDVFWPNSSAQCDVLLGAVFNLGPFNLGVRALDGSGIDTVFLYYRINSSGVYDSVGMTRATNPADFCNWIGNLPAVSDSDTVQYYVRAIDASVRSNQTILPDSANPRQFVALAGIRFPYVDNFDLSDVWSGFIVDNAGIRTSGGWLRGTPAKTEINAARSAPNAWITGPLNANTPNSVHYILESPVFDFSTAENATLSFWQWRNIEIGTANPIFGNGLGDGFWIEYTTNVNATTPVWNRLGNSNQNDTNQLNWYNRANISGLPGANLGAWDGTSGGWIRSERRLIEPFFQGANGAGSMKFRFVYRSNANIPSQGVAIDDFSVTIPPSRDLALTTIAANAASQPISIANNNFQVIAGDPVVLFLRLRNFGTQLIDTVIPVVVEVGSYRDTTYLTPGAIQPNAFTFNSLRLDTIPNAPARWFTVRVFSLLPNDGNRINDTIQVEMYGVPVRNVPASDNFDGVNDWLPMAVGTAPVIWERGVPTGTLLNTALSPPNVWGTVLGGAVGAGQSGILLSPLFNFNNAVNTRLRFSANRRFLQNAGMRISFADNLFQTFQPLGAFNDPAAINWYNNQSSLVNGVTGPAWIGSTTGYVEHTLELPPAFNYRPGRGVRFRFEFTNSTSGGVAGEGVTIDNFEILPPPPREVGIIAISGPRACPDSIRAIDTIIITVRNYGGDTLTSVPVNFNFNRGPLQYANDYIITKTILPGQNVTDTILPGFVSPQPPGNYDMRVFTRLSGDARLSNDTIVRCIKSIAPTELQMVSILSPPDVICFPTGDRIVRFVVRNQGHSPTDSVRVGYQLDSLPPVVQLRSLVIQARGGIDTVLITLPVSIPEGTSLLRVFVNSSSDPNRTNDTLSRSLIGRFPLQIPHLNNFEGPVPVPYCTSTGMNALIELRDNLISQNNPGGKVLLMGSQGPPANFSTVVPPDPWVPTWNPTSLAVVAFPIETTNRDSLRIRFRLLQIAGGNLPAERISLFRVVANGVQVATYQPSGVTPPANNYQLIDLPLHGLYTPGEPMIIEFQSKVRSRLLLTGTQRNGNLIDDIIIYNSMPNGAEVLDVTYSPPFPSQTTPVTVTAKVRNAGRNVLNNVQMNLQINGTLIQTVTPNLNLPFMVDSNYSFTTTFNPLLGVNDVCVWSALPNGQPDGYTLDDSLCTEAIGFPVINNFPYCDDFDSGKPLWLSRNPITLRSTGNNFTFGTPDKGFINGAASGQNAWYIGGDSTYKPYDSSAVYTPIFDVKSNECYRVSFKSKWLTDFLNNDTTKAALAGDGGTIEYSTDGGSNFTNFGRLDTVSFEWYNNSVQSLRNFSSTPASLGLGWTGKTRVDDWVEMRQVFNTTTNTQVMFRFRFGSDDAFQGEGFAMDDFCFEIIPGPCNLVNVGEEDLQSFGLKQNYPNPFASTTTLEYQLPTSGRVLIEVRDLLGRRLMALDEGILEEGRHTTELDLSRMEAGVYFYTVNFNGMEKTMKMILSK
jgi:hypothetical protein